jgi:hypothetical protein
MEQLGSYYTDFHNILNLIISRKSVQKTKVSLKSDKKTAILHEDKITILSYFAQFMSEREMFRTKFVDRITTRILCSIFFFENRAFY